MAGFYEDSPPSACMGAAILLYCYYFTENGWGFFEVDQADSSVLVAQNASCLVDSYKLLHIRGSERKKKPSAPI